MIWANQYQQNEDSHQQFYAMRETDDGVVIGGNTQYAVWVIKIDLDGEVIWMQNYRVGQHIVHAYAHVSSTDGGFLLTGSIQDNGSFYTYIIKIDERGNRDWLESIPVDVYEWGFDLLSIDDTGFVIAGKHRLGDNCMGEDSSWEPVLIRTTRDGDLRYREVYDFGVEWGWQGLGNQFYSAVMANHGSLVATGLVVREDTRMDGLVMKLEPENLQIDLSWTPEDTVFSVLPGDSVQFTIFAEEQQGIEFYFLWLAHEDTLGIDSTLSYLFRDSVDVIIQCQISNWAMMAPISWHVTAEEWYIDTHTPDSLSWTIRRPREVDFSLGVRAIEGVEPQYRWILTGHRGEREDVGDAANLTYDFDRPGEYSLEGRAFYEGDVRSVTWQITVNSVLYWWTPHERALSVEQGDELDAGLFYRFRSLGEHSVTAIVHDGAEVDTVFWSITVVDIQGVGEGTEGLLPTEVTLYPAAPNPFNSTTSIRYFLPRWAEVRLTVYDSAGRRVQTLVEGWTMAGEHRATLQGTGFRRGCIYLGWRLALIFGQ